MISAIVRAGLLAGAASAAMYIARRFYGSETDQALGKAKSVAKDIGDDITRTDKSVTTSLRDV